MAKKNLHVVITVDKNREFLKMDFCESINETDILSSSSMKIIDFKLLDFVDGDEERAKLTIGSTVLGLLHNLIEGGIGLRDNDIETEADLRAEECLRKMAGKGDASAKHSLGNTFLYKSIKSKNVKLLDEAEYWFKESAKDGYELAVEFMEKYWDKVKEDSKRKIIESFAHRKKVQ